MFTANFCLIPKSTVGCDDKSDYMLSFDGMFITENDFVLMYKENRTHFCALRRLALACKQIKGGVCELKDKLEQKS